MTIPAPSKYFQLVLPCQLGIPTHPPQRDAQSQVSAPVPLPVLLCPLHGVDKRGPLQGEGRKAMGERRDISAGPELQQLSGEGRLGRRGRSRGRAVCAQGLGEIALEG